jgi:hypothetical protein
MANAKIMLGERDGVTELLEESSSLADKAGSPAGAAKCQEVYARLLSMTGGHQEAERRYLSAASIYEDIGQGYDVAQVLLELGLMLSANGRAGDAAVHLAKAGGLFRGMGLERSAAAAERALSGLGKGPGDPRK